MLFAKVGIKSCRGARECISFVHACICMQLPLAAILYLEILLQEQFLILCTYVCTYVST